MHRKMYRETTCSSDRPAGMSDRRLTYVDLIRQQRAEAPCQDDLSSIIVLERVAVPYLKLHTPKCSTIAGETGHEPGKIRQLGIDLGRGDFVPDRRIIFLPRDPEIFSGAITIRHVECFEQVCAPFFGACLYCPIFHQIFGHDAFV